MSDRPKTRRQKLDNNYFNFVNYHEATIRSRQNNEPFDLGERMYRHSLRRIYAIAKTYKVTRRWDYHNGSIYLDDEKLMIEYTIHLSSKVTTHQVIVQIKDGELDLEDYTP